MQEQSDYDPDDLVAPREAARILGIHRNTLVRWTDNGTIQVVLIDGKRFYSSTHLMELTDTPPPA